MKVICGNRDLLDYVVKKKTNVSDEDIVILDTKDKIHDYCFKKEDAIYLAVGWTHSEEWLEEIFANGADSVSIVPVFAMWYNLPVDSGRHIERVNRDTLILKYLEMHVADTCNLKCRGCMHFSNLETQEGFPNLEKFEKDISRMKELFPVILMIRLLGGEPFLNPKLDKYAGIIRKYYPFSEIRVVTNGLMIPQVADTVWNGLRQSMSALDISPYPPTVRNSEKFLSVLKEKEIPCGGIGKEMNRFRKSLVTEPHTNMKQATEICGSSHCRSLRDGKIAKCPMPFQIETFDRVYGKDIHSKDIYDIYEVESGRWLKEKLDRFCDMCSYCPDKEEYISWEVAGADRATQTDWITG